jgi:hypothetical protein
MQPQAMYQPTFRSGASLMDGPRNLSYHRYRLAPKMIAKFASVSGAYSSARLPASSLQSPSIRVRLVHHFTNNH